MAHQDQTSSSDSRARLQASHTAPRRLWADRVATWVVTAGGLAIIASILGILLFILLEVLPLTGGADVDTVGRLDAAAISLPALVADEHRNWLVGLDRDGTVRVVDRTDGTLTETVDALATARRLDVESDVETDAESDAETDAETDAATDATSTDATPAAPATDAGAPLVAVASLAGGEHLAGAGRDGRILLVPVRFRVTFEGDQRRVEPVVEDGTSVVLDPEGRPLGPWAARVADDGGLVTAAVTADGSLSVARLRVRENLLTGAVDETLTRASVPVPQAISVLALGDDGSSLYAGTQGGEILAWNLGPDARPGELEVVSAGTSPVTALTLLIGGQSLVVGQADGSLSVWFPVRQDDGDQRLTRIRDFPAHEGPVLRLAASRRDKGFLAGDAVGAVGLYHSTSHRRLWRQDLGLGPVLDIFYTPKADGAYVVGAESLAVLDIDNPHPEITWKTLFGKVWYEGYQEPTWVWQSSGATDEVEPKLSLMPLLVGTFKGTFYSLIIAIPLAVLGAMYLSQFMHPMYKRYIKPVVEVMASLPSVVLGFLAGLWLAPRVEDAVPGIVAMFVVLPLVVLASGWLWHRLPKTARGRIPAGTEMFLFAGTLALGVWASLAASPMVEQIVFGGDFQLWLRQGFGIPYDQRNAVIVGLAMGFAVIPIIFAIAEDAFSNVPRNLVAGSLALGATRWQTVTRVVLPTASPGIFSAIMVGFGRAVGETMIVLMATGNTPIMDWNPFNGFRTLSANIAVEIPEAPQGGSLYRTLFLAALLLFVLTFVINTVAEIVRQRLRERYSQL